VLVVEDAGPGVGDAADGTGIRGMRERAVLVGARLDLDSRADRGTRVRLVLDGGQGE
jgi:two-component system sensor histidine kinase UhpB